MVERARRRRARPEVTTADEKIRVSATTFGDEEESRETIETRRFATDPAYLRVNAGVTKNMGNYESLRLDVSISVPCYKEEVDDVYERVSDKVSEMLEAELKKYDVE